MRTAPPKSEELFAVERIGKRFGGVVALDDVTFGMTPGETFGLIGPNGSGKTTLVNCVSGVLAANAGQVRLFGRRIDNWSRRKRARAGLVRTYQNLRLFPHLTAAENVEVGALLRSDAGTRERRRIVAAALADQDIEALQRVQVRDLSYGEQRRVEIARALAAEPKLLVLDEPAAGLGTEETERLRASLARARERLDFAMLVIDHDVSLITQLSDRILVLHEGRPLTLGTPDEVVANPDVIALYLGSEN